MAFRISSAFLGRERRLRNGWWVAAFLATVAALLFPTILVSARLGVEVTIWMQALILVLATWVIQALRRKPLQEVTGALNGRWLGSLLIGGVFGAALMLLPALFLTLGGWVGWQAVFPGWPVLASALLLMAGVAFAEELLFRGVLFQRLIDGVGIWPAQVMIAALFVLTHMGNPGMEGATRFWAGANIFLASILFGLAYVRTRSLALPIGIHFMANVTQGIILGFGVSGTAEPGIFAPRFLTDQAWLTGGVFGLEASLPGLVVVSMAVIAFIAFNRRKPPVPAPPAA